VDFRSVIILGQFCLSLITTGRPPKWLLTCLARNVVWFGLSRLNDKKSVDTVVKNPGFRKSRKPNHNQSHLLSRERKRERIVCVEILWKTIRAGKELSDPNTRICPTRKNRVRTQLLCPNLKTGHSNMSGLKTESGSDLLNRVWVVRMWCQTRARTNSDNWTVRTRMWTG